MIFCIVVCINNTAQISGHNLNGRLIFDQLIRTENVKTVQFLSQNHFTFQRGSIIRIVFTMDPNAARTKISYGAGWEIYVHHGGVGLKFFVLP